MSNKVTVKESSVSGLTLLGILFIGLKLTGYINWSWWWVTAPFWGPLALVIAIFGLAVVGIWVLEKFE